MQPAMFLPTSAKEMKALGWNACDIILISGDAYIDHPGFGTALIGRVLENAGYKVGIIDQPDWKNDKDFLELGTPNLFFGISAGNIDSMVSHYTVNRKKRSRDAYSPNGKMGLRPNRATIVYTNKVKALFKNTHIVIGGIEASLRRIAHYDYWDDKVRRSILLDSKADILVYGMGEKPILDVAQHFKNKQFPDSVPGTVVKSKLMEKSGIELPDYETVSTDKLRFNDMVKKVWDYRNPHHSKLLYQRFGTQLIKINIPSDIMSEKEMDAIYDLPFQKYPHPKYSHSKIPAFEQIFSSITSHRGCYGNCSFCAISAHQGSAIQSRSEESILKEVKNLAKHQQFKGTISDIGGPSANMYKVSCKIGGCKTMNCLFPTRCKHLMVEKQSDYVTLLEKSKKVPGVKNVFVASGLRHDLLMENIPALKSVIQDFTGGHLKIAPEHLDKDITDLMQKPDGSVYEKFSDYFRKYSKEAGKMQYVVPYFISGHPGSTLEKMRDLKLYLKKTGHRLQQAADFYPTPMTLSTAMYYTGFHPLSGEKVVVPKSYREKNQQFKMMMWHKSASKDFKKPSPSLDEFDS